MSGLPKLIIMAVLAMSSGAASVTGSKLLQPYVNRLGYTVQAGRWFFSVPK